MRRRSAIPRLRLGHTQIVAVSWIDDRQGALYPTAGPRVSPSDLPSAPSVPPHAPREGGVVADLICPPIARRPEDLPDLFTEAVSDGDLDAAVALYETDGRLALWDERAALGHQQLRDALGEILAIKLPLRRRAGHVFATGSIALLHGHWSIRGRAPGRQPLDLAGRHFSVVRRQADGAWLIAVDRWAYH
jgi:ketosteroid isomerase-like protein